MTLTSKARNKQVNGVIYSLKNKLFCCKISVHLLKELMKKPVKPGIKEY